MSNPSFSILITTKNRLSDLVFTLNKIKYLLENKSVVCIVCDDGSNDGTALFLQTNYPEIKLIQNLKTQGLIYSRNRLLSLVSTDFAISLDDDAHFLAENPLEPIRNYFQTHPSCGVLAFRIFWGVNEPDFDFNNDKPERVQGFVGCGHVWNMKAWNDIPNYPTWFVFYGEEDFASFQLFKKNWQVLYLPEVLVNHRVDIKARKKNKDYVQRQRRSLRSGWYLLFLFYPISKIPKEFIYSIWIQFKTKVCKGDFKALQAIVLALFDLILSIPKIVKNSNRLSKKEFQNYNQLSPTKLYWQPEK